MSDLEPGPFLEWLDRRTVAHGPPWAALAAAWGFSEDAAAKRVWRWRNEASRIPSDQVEDALGAFGVFLWDLYDEEAVRLPSGRKPPSHKGFPITIPEDVLLEAHRRHLDEGLSTRAMGREYFDRCGSKSPRALSRCFHNAFKQRGWVTLSQGEAMALFNRRKVAHIPRCEHVIQGGANRGKRCSRRTSRPSGRCWHHEPERLAAVMAMFRDREAA